MKSTSILLALIAVVALAAMAVLLSTPSTGGPPVTLGGMEALEQDTRDQDGERALAEAIVPEKEVEVARTVVVDEVAERAAKKQLLQEQEAAEGPFLRGQVINSLGFGVPNAAIKVIGDGNSGSLLALSGGPFMAEATTDANGGFQTSRRGLYGEEVKVMVRARGFQFFQTDVTPDKSSGDANLGSLELVRGVILAGTVRNAKGLPIEGAKVRRTNPGEEGMLDGFMGMAAMFSGQGSTSTVTDAEGKFELANEPPGQYVVVAQHDAFEKARLEGNAPYINFEALNLALDFPPSASIAGVIEGFPGGKRFVKVKAIPIEDKDSEDVEGMAMIMSTFTGGGYSSDVLADGSFLIQGLPRGKQFDVNASLNEGFMQETACSDTVRTESGVNDVKLTYDRGAMVTFRLLDDTSGDKVTESTIRFRWIGDGADRFQFGAKKRDFASSLIELDELRPDEEEGGLLALTITSPGYQEYTETDIPIQAGELVDLGSVELAKAAILRVRVLEAESGKPLSRARVSLTSTMAEDADFESMSRDLATLTLGGESERTDRDGWVELAASSTPTATLTVRRSGYALFVKEDVIMPQGGWREEFVNLSEGGELEVSVVDTLGNPVSQATVQYKAPAGSDASGTTSKKGRIKFRDLVPGDYMVTAGRPGDRSPFRVQPESMEGKSTWTPVKVVSGVDQEITLRVAQDTILRGVVMAGGRPLAGANVEFVNGRDGEASGSNSTSRRMSRRFGGTQTATSSDANGQFTIKGLSPGEHRLSIQPSDAVPNQYVAIDLQEGENNGTFDLKVGTIEGVVLDASGNPAGGAKISVRLEGDDDDDNMRFMRAMFRDDGGEKAREDGTFTIVGVPTDTPIVVHAALKGHTAGMSEAVTVGEGEREGDIKISLGQGASIRVVLTGEAAPFQMVRAELLEAEEGEDEQEVFRFVQGNEALLKDLVPGRWKVRLGSSGDAEPVEITVLAGEEGFVTLQRGG